MRPNHRAGHGEGQRPSKISVRWLVGLLAGLGLVAAGLVATGAITNPALAGSGGDNGTVKTHNVGTSTDDVRDEPKVSCQGFYLDAFFFDGQQSVGWKIVEDTHGDTKLSGAITLDDSGHGYTDTLQLDPGMYKLYWNFDGEHGEAKHKVFKVDDDCTPPPPTQVTPAAPTATTPDCDNPNEVVTPSNQEGVVWSPSGATTLKPGDSVTYTATPADGFAFPDGAQTSWTFTNTFDTSTCQQPPTQVTPAAPTATTPDCKHPTETVTPSTQEGVVWSPAVPTVLAPGDSVTYTATPADGFAFPDGAQTSWTFTNTFDTSTCISPPPPIHQGKKLTVSKSCGQFTLHNHNGFVVNVSYTGGKLTLPAHGEKTVKTSRHHVHFVATGSSANGHVVLSQSGNVTVRQNCGHHHHHGHKPPKTPTHLPDTGYNKPAAFSTASGGQQNTSAIFMIVFGGLLALGASMCLANQLVPRRRRVGER